MKKSSIVLACLLVIGACSKDKELDKRTESMEKATEKVSTVTNEMKGTTDSMYLQLRSGNSLATRNQEFDKLMSDEEHVLIRTRIAGACGFFKAFEYQLWTDNQSFDDERSRQIMYVDAVTEFTRRAGDLYESIGSDIKKMSPTNQSSRHKNEIAFYAIAVSLHLNHNYQDEVVRQDSKLQTNSIYDMMKKALTKEKNKRMMDEHEDILLNGTNREVMIELIKARVDIMTALALGNLTNKRDMTLGQKAKGALFKITGGWIGKIELPETYTGLNDSTKMWTEKYLNAALESRDFLKTIGVKKALEKTLKSAMKEIDFDEKKLTKDEKAKQAADGKKETIRNMINQLLEI
jgi:hypothetical protein